MLNYLWLALVLIAVLLGGFNGRLSPVTEAAFDAARTAVMNLALPLVGITALWLGVMRLAEKAGLIQSLARWLRPVLCRLFPDVPVDHPAMGSMLMNMAANMIGLTNAATPLGLRAMTDLERLNCRPGTATNAMCTFLALNTSSLQLIPTTAIGLMAAAGSTHPTAIVGTTLIATFCSTVVGVLAVKTLERLPGFRLPVLARGSGTPAPPPPSGETAQEVGSPSAGPSPEAARPAEPTARRSAPAWIRNLVLVGFAGLLVVFFFQAMQQPSNSTAESGPFIRSMNAVSLLAIPALLGFFPLYAALHRVRVYEEFVEGAKEGFQVAVRIIPYLVAMLVAIGMFRAAGGADLLARGLAPVLDWIGFPAELLPMAFTRPLSGSASIGLFGDLVKTLGPDHLITRMGGTLLGSTETTFYVIAVYFGAVSVNRPRHAVAAGLLADAAGMLAAVYVCRLVFV